MLVELSDDLRLDLLLFLSQWVGLLFLSGLLVGGGAIVVLSSLVSVQAERLVGLAFLSLSDNLGLFLEKLGILALALQV